MRKRSTVADIARETGLSIATIRRYCDDNRISHVKTFRGWRWFPDPEKAIQEINKLLGLEANCGEREGKWYAERESECPRQT